MDAIAALHRTVFYLSNTLAEKLQEVFQPAYPSVISPELVSNSIQ